MARLPCIIVAALTAASCASAREQAAEEAPPAWFDERIREAQASDRGYPSLDDVPNYRPKTPSRTEWQQGIDTMEVLKAAVLSDPAMADPDASGDSDDFARRSRADAARDMQRQSVED